MILRWPGNPLFAVVAGLFWFGVLSSGFYAQTPDDEPIRVDTLLINIPLVVSDRDGRYVGGLRKEDFTILLDGEKQEIEYFGNSEAPVSVAIVLDMSGSTRPYLREIQTAAKTFVEKLNPADQGVLLTFDQFARIEVVCPLTNDHKKLAGRINTLVSVYDGFADRRREAIFPDMYDTIYQAMTREFAGIRGRKAVIVLTDGFVVGRTVSPKTFDDTIIEGDAVIYPMMFLTSQHVGRNRSTIKYDDLLKQPVTVALDDIAKKTGGRLIVASKGTDFDRAFQTIGDELRKQYVLGFQPPNIANLKTAQITLVVSNPAMKIRTKNIIRVKRRVDPPPEATPKR